MRLNGPAHSSKFMEWHNSGIITRKPAICAPRVFKIGRKPNNYQFYLPNIFKLCHNISHKLLRPNQSLEKIYKFWNGPLCINKSGPSP